MATISKRYKMEAAHQLPGHRGKCANPHGHSYKVIVSYTGNVRYAINEGTGPQFNCDESSDAMVFDFDDLSQVMDPVIARLDHQDLNVLLAPHRTTAENIAMYILKEVIDSPSFKWTEVDEWTVEVQETETSSVKVSMEDLEASDL